MLPVSSFLRKTLWREETGHVENKGKSVGSYPICSLHAESESFGSSRRCVNGTVPQARCGISGWIGG